MDHPSSSKRAKMAEEHSDSEDSNCSSSEFSDFSDNSDFELSSGFGIDSDTDSDSESDHENIPYSGSIPPSRDQLSTPREEQSQFENTPSTSFGRRQWTDLRKPAINIPFSGTSGLKIDMAGDKSIDFFNAIANDSFYELIINQSNEYSAEVLSLSNESRSRIKCWKNITVAEFKTWLGLLFHMGTIRLNRIHDYWKKHHLFNIQAFSQYMSRDRFLAILRTLHFNKNTQNTASLDKIQPLVDFFNERMETIYAPRRHLSIDESLVLWRGKLKFRQFIKGKKAKYGIKIYMLGESSGLALKLVIYGGAADKELGGKGHTDKVVHKLMDGKTGDGHALFMDNYYNSVPLVEDLLSKSTYVTGTLRSNRKDNPLDVKNKKLKPRETVSQYTDRGVCVTKWKDRREVLAISSEFDGQLSETTNRRGKLVIKPNMIIEYNRYMSGIDFHDQMLSYYPCERKTLRWYKKLGVHIFQTILLNACYLYNNNKDKKVTLYDFRLSVIDALLGAPPSPFLPLPRNKIHLPVLFDKDAKGKTKRKRCKYCWHHDRVRKDSIYCCKECSDKPGFCLDPCFRLFHKYN